MVRYIILRKLLLSQLCFKPVAFSFKMSVFCWWFTESLRCTRSGNDVYFILRCWIIRKVPKTYTPIDLIFFFCKRPTNFGSLKIPKNLCCLVSTSLTNNCFSSITPRSGAAACDQKQPLTCWERVFTVLENFGKWFMVLLSDF